MRRHPRKYLRPKWYLGLVPGGKDRSGLKELGREREENHWLACVDRASGSRASWEGTLKGDGGDSRGTERLWEVSQCREGSLGWKRRAYMRKGEDL